MEVILRSTPLEAHVNHVLRELWPLSNPLSESHPASYNAWPSSQPDKLEQNWAFSGSSVDWNGRYFISIRGPSVWLATYDVPLSSPWFLFICRITPDFPCIQRFVGIICWIFLVDFAHAIFQKTKAFLSSSMRGTIYAYLRFELLKTKHADHRPLSIRLHSRNSNITCYLTTRHHPRGLCTHLKLQNLWLLPGKALVAEVSILCSPAVDGVSEIQFLDDDTWP